MKKQEVIEQLLRSVSHGQWSISSAFGGAGSTSGIPQVLPADVNKAIELWLKDDNAAGVQQLAGTLHITGAITDTEYEQIMEAIGGKG